MSYSQYQWLKGPALQIMAQVDAFQPGDFVKVGGVSVGWGTSKVAIIVESRSRFVRRPQVCLLLESGAFVYIHPAHSIRAWCRPPLDLEL